MNIKYGLGLVEIENIDSIQKIEINFVGNFFINKPNLSFLLHRKRNKLIFSPLTKILSNNLLFRYNGIINITNCTIGKRSVKIIKNNIDRYNKLESTWDTLNSEWHDYNMDDKINTIKKSKIEKMSKKL